jgi:hypothetical protein
LLTTGEIPGTVTVRRLLENDLAQFVTCPDAPVACTNCCSDPPLTTCTLLIPSPTTLLLRYSASRLPRQQIASTTFADYPPHVPSPILNYPVRQPDILLTTLLLNSPCRKISSNTFSDYPPQLLSVSTASSTSHLPSPTATLVFNYTPRLAFHMHCFLEYPPRLRSSTTLHDDPSCFLGYPDFSTTLLINYQLSSPFVSYPPLDYLPSSFLTPIIDYPH